MDLANLRNRLKEKDCSKIEIIATDMDGTFFSSGLSVLPETLQAYNRAIGEGIQVIPATGRSYEGVKTALIANSLDQAIHLEPGVYLNGCLTLGKNGRHDVLNETLINEKVVEGILDAVTKINADVMKNPEWDKRPEIKDAPPEHGFYAVTDRTYPSVFLCVAAYAKGCIVYEEENQLTFGLRQFRDGEMKPVGPLLDYARRYGLNKLLILAHSGDLIDRYRPQFTEALGSPPLAFITCAVRRVLEVVPQGIDKITGLRAIAEHQGFSLSNVAAIGDGENDIQMLRSCGVSIAMGGSRPSVVQSASAETTGVDAGGWSLAVNTLLDLRREARKTHCRSVSEGTLSSTATGHETTQEVKLSPPTFQEPASVGVQAHECALTF